MDWTGALVTIVSVVLSVGLASLAALWQFRRQKLWDNRFTLYSNVLEALYQMAELTGKHVEADINDREIDESERELLSNEYRKAQDRLWKLVAIGGLTLPRSALDSLRKILVSARVRSDDDDYWSMIQREDSVLRAGINEFLVLARKDLEIPDEPVAIANSHGS